MTTTFRHFLIAPILLLLLCSCGGKEGYYLTYDIVEGREGPSEDFPVMWRFSCVHPLDKTQKNDLPFYDYSRKGMPDPITVRKVDPTGRWGYVREGIPFIREVKGWIPLDEMLYCGSGRPDEKVPAYTVKEKSAYYRHPRIAESESLGTIAKGDTVQVWTSKGKWAHARFQKARQKIPRYGWIQTSRLSPIDSLSQKDIQQVRTLAHNERLKVDEQRRAKAEEKKFARLDSLHAVAQAEAPKVKEALDIVDSKDAAWWRKALVKKTIISQMLYADPLAQITLYKKICGWGALLALAFAVLLFVPTVIRGKGQVSLIWMPLCALLLAAVYFIQGILSWGFAVLVILSCPVVSWVALYLVLFFPRFFPLGIIWRLLYMLLSCSLGYTAFVVMATALDKMNSFLFVPLMWVCGIIYLILTYVFSRWVRRSICPRCGYWGKDGEGLSFSHTDSFTMEHWKEDELGRRIAGTTSFTTHTTIDSAEERDCGRCGRSYTRFQFGVGKIGEVLYELDEFLDGVEEFTEELVEGICEPVEDWAVSHFGPKE